MTLRSSGPTINNAIIYREYFNLYFQNNTFNTEMVQEYQFTLKVRKGHELEALHCVEQNVITALPISSLTISSGTALSQSSGRLLSRGNSCIPDATSVNIVGNRVHEKELERI